MIRSYIALGSNQGSPLAQIYGALSALKRLPGSRLSAQSRLYGTRAVGPGAQEDYINVVVAIDTALSADELLTALQRIENHHGRQRDIRWGPRTLDLDILLYGDQYIDSPRLTVPHPRLGERRFVLLPLADIDARLARQYSQLPPAETTELGDDIWLLDPDQLASHAE